MSITAPGLMAPGRYAISGTQLYVVDGASYTFDVTYFEGLPALTALHRERRGNLERRRRLR
mgnify:CR=1 FL=1